MFIFCLLMYDHEHVYGSELERDWDKDSVARAFQTNRINDASVCSPRRWKNDWNHHLPLWHASHNQLQSTTPKAQNSNVSKLYLLNLHSLSVIRTHYLTILVLMHNLDEDCSNLFFFLVHPCTWFEPMTSQY